MMIGLKKRPTYDELVNSLDTDPIKHYPDRRATQMENSNYMSQLATGFQEVVIQSNRLMQEKTKSILLQDLGHASHISHREMQVSSSGVKASSNDGSFDSAGSLSFISEPVARPSFLPAQDRGLLTPLFSNNFEEERQQKVNHLHKILDDEDQDFNDTVRLVTQPLIQRQEQIERHYEDQLAIQAYENVQQRERHHQNLLNVRQDARSMIDNIYGQMMPTMAEMPRYIGTGSAASSSSAAPMPMRMAIQDLTPVEPKTDSDEEELIPAEPIVIPSNLRPKEEEVRHLFKPKTERVKKPQAHGQKIYYDTATGWQNEHINVLKEQLRLRPDIKLKKSEIDHIPKDRAVAFLLNYDKMSSKK